MAAPTVISSQSTQYINVAITGPLDPTTAPVSFAFLGPYATTQQASSATVTSATTWYVGSWGETTSYPTTYVAQCLVGADGGVVTLGSGSYLVYVTVQGGVETPVLWSGPLVVA